MKKIYIVTGATGFVGSNLVKKLVEKGKIVYGYVRSKEKANLVLSGLSLKLFFGDIRDKNSFNNMFDDKDAEYIVMNTAAVVLLDGKKKEYLEMEDVNINGVKNVINCCLENNARLIHISSVHAITEPKNRALTSEIEIFDPDSVHGPYAKTKAAASAIIIDAIKNRNLNAIMLHPSGITGPGDYGNSHLTQMVADYLSGRIPAGMIGGYDFVDVRDVCNGIILAEEKGKPGNCYLLTNQYYTIKELLDTLYELSGYKKIKLILPMWMAQVGMPFLAMGAKLSKKRPLYTSYSLYTLRSNSNYTHEKAAKELGYKPRELKESLWDTIQFLKEMRNL
jgi:dihydroflavonol-4-reductase